MGGWDELQHPGVDCSIICEGESQKYFHFFIIIPTRLDTVNNFSLSVMAFSSLFYLYTEKTSAFNAFEYGALRDAISTDESRELFF